MDDNELLIGDSISCLKANKEVVVFCFTMEQAKSISNGCPFYTIIREVKGIGFSVQKITCGNGKPLYKESKKVKKK